MRLEPNLDAYVKQNGSRDIKKAPSDIRWSMSKEFNKIKANDKHFYESMKQLMELGLIFGQPQTSKEELKASKSPLLMQIWKFSRNTASTSQKSQRLRKTEQSG